MPTSSGTLTPGRSATPRACAAGFRPSFAARRASSSLSNALCELKSQKCQARRGPLQTCPELSVSHTSYPHPCVPCFTTLTFGLPVAQASLEALKPNSTFTPAISGLGCLAAGLAQAEAGRAALEGFYCVFLLLSHDVIVFLCDCVSIFSLVLPAAGNLRRPRASLGGDSARLRVHSTLSLELLLGDPRSSFVGHTGGIP